MSYFWLIFEITYAYVCDVKYNASVNFKYKFVYVRQKKHLLKCRRFLRALWYPVQAPAYLLTLAHALLVVMNVKLTMMVCAEV